MARNYVELFVGRVNLGGNYNSFAAETEDECIAKVDAFVHNFGGTVDFKAAKAYFLFNKFNLVGLINIMLAHNSSAWGSAYVFFQDGLKAKVSPRDTWSNGE